jgi:hypothetical protein
MLQRPLPLTGGASGAVRRSPLERISSNIGHAWGHRVGIRGKRADIWSPHTVLGRGVPGCDIVASSHGLGCEYGCRDQHSQLPVVKIGLLLEIFHHALSTKREPLWPHPVMVAAMIAA